ncbi:ankyrin repeat domain-containing protein 1-like, partial [Gigantopelta aegis]|uniref:ankyrin repeat domain-containing protein 1-like n=1 Tax=Gigantopelta aegis TaxID=1735272 RepID=UPI001B88E14D
MNNEQLPEEAAHLTTSSVTGSTPGLQKLEEMILDIGARLDSLESDSRDTSIAAVRYQNKPKKKRYPHANADALSRQPCTAATKVICGPSESELIKEQTNDPILAKIISYIKTKTVTKNLKDQQTSLHLASKGGYYDIVQLLLNSNADPNIFDEHQQTSLHLASNGGYYDIVQLLLNSKADPNICDRNQQTSLHLASNEGYCDIVQLLLNSKADLNICDRYGRTPAHYAAENGHFDALRLLITVGQADINVTDE